MHPAMKRNLPRRLIPKRSPPGQRPGLIMCGIRSRVKDAVTYNGKAVTPKYNEELQFALRVKT